MSSSMRNAIQRRVHRERAQPHQRGHLGILEKHKDYALRALDYAKKKKKLRALRLKAATRNDDEFYFGMMSRTGPGSAITAGDIDSRAGGKKSWTGTVGTRNGDRGDGVTSLAVEAVRLLKAQDLGYVRSVRNVAAKELHRVEEEAVLAGIAVPPVDGAGSSKRRRRMSMLGGGGRKIVFLDEHDPIGAAVSGERDPEDEADQRPTGGTEAETDDEWNGLDDFDEGPAVVMEQSDKVPEESDKGPEERREARARLEKRLEHARHKLTVLSAAETKLDEQRAKMAKTATSGGTTRKGGKQIVVRRRKR